MNFKSRVVMLLAVLLWCFMVGLCVGQLVSNNTSVETKSASYEISVLVEEESTTTKAVDILLEYPLQMALSNDSSFMYFIHDVKTIGKVSMNTNFYEVVYSDIGVQWAGIAVTPNNIIYYSDEYLNAIHKFQNGVSNKVVGTSITGLYNGNNLKGTLTALNRPIGLFYTEIFSSQGELYFADESNSLIRKLVIANGTVSNVAGNVVAGYSGDGGEATSASLRYPSSVYVSNSGEIYIADTFNCVIRKVSNLGIIGTVAGVGGQCGYNQDSINATESKLNFPTGITVSDSGDLYIVDKGNHRIRKVSATTGLIETIVGGGFNTGYGISGTSAQLNNPTQILLNNQNELFISDTNHHRLLKYSNGIVTLVAGYSNVEESTSPIDNVEPTIAKLKYTYGVATNSKNEVFFSDAYNHRIVKIENGVLKQVAGKGVAGFDNNIDGLLATDVSLNYPYEIAIQPSTQDLFISDTHNHRILRVDSTSGRIYRFMGSGIPGYNGEGSDLLNLQLNNPQGLSFSGDILIVSDTFNHRIRKVFNSTSSTILGTQFGGKEPPSTLVLSDIMLKFPRFALLKGTILAVADTKNYLIRDFDISTQSVYGNSQTLSTIHTPTSIVYTNANEKYYVNAFGHYVLDISIKQQKLIGTLTKGFLGDYQSGTLARMRYPHSFCLDNNGDYIIGDTLNSVIRKYSTNSTIFTTIAGFGTRRLPDRIVNDPKGKKIIVGVSLASTGDFYVTDITYNRIIKGNVAQKTFNTYAGPFLGGINMAEGSISSFKMQTPTAVFSHNDNLYVIDNSRLLKYSKDGNVKTLFSSFTIVKDFIHVDSSGKIYFMDAVQSTTTYLYVGFENNFQVYSGNGTDDTSDGIDRSLVGIYKPAGLFFHEQKSELYFSDIYRIRKFSKEGTISTIAGLKGSNGYSGENVNAASSTLLTSPKSIFVNTIGEVFFIELSRVRKISTNGTLFTIAGNGSNILSSPTMYPTNTSIGTPISLSFNSKTGVFAMIELRKRVTLMSPYCSDNFSVSSIDATICIPICFGKTEDGACGGANQGQCISPNTCSCQKNWNGTQCEINSNTSVEESTTRIILIATLVPILSILLILVLIAIIIVIAVVVLCKKKKKQSNSSIATVSDVELKNSNLSTLDISTTTGTFSDYPDEVSYFFKTSTNVRSVKSGSSSSITDAFNPLSRYSNLQKIGAGGFGSVFKCLDQNNNPRVLKAMRFNSYSELSLFMKEGLQLLNMNHPNIVKVNDLFIDQEELLFIEMDYYEKGDLSYLLKNPEFCTEEILRQIIEQMGRALDFIHNEKKLIHRDIKPSNIFIKEISNTNIQIVLADFGLARDNSTSNKSYAGTPLYCSPELGLGSNYGPETDIYSLGVTLYQLISKDVSTSISHYFLTKNEEQVEEILKNQMNTGSGNKYSAELITQITEMVRRDPSKRPKPQDFCNHK
ncbi:predicted protein [Naegleria gruberi]|uniref:Predicted protein n=1 Tax=Naegleria gruberi TaxID=5762 RepID=D2VNU7_NAEGR|nr:uncharacterized protein NAEGRDRAFT_70624 [Naegleria gruberi]EFC41556.1 predicted protein [Naegleria gruberi]|eukprot:XP_002674300.1 predicted protein [Naegleria gruberi strain NEG-M]